MPNFLSNIKQMISSGLNTIENEESPPPIPPTAESVRDGFEHKDANVLALFLAASGIVITGIIIQLVLGLSFSSYKHRRIGVDQSEQTPPADFLEGSDPEKKLADYRSQMQHTLNTYGWVDREKKIVRIPIEKAMERLSHAK